MPLPLGAMFPTISDFAMVTLLFPTYTPPPEIPAVLPAMSKCESEKGVVLRLELSKSNAPPKEFVAVLLEKVDVPMVTVVPAPNVLVAIAPPIPGAVLFVNVEPLMDNELAVVGLK